MSGPCVDSNAEFGSGMPYCLSRLGCDGPSKLIQSGHMANSTVRSCSYRGGNRVKTVAVKAVSFERGEECMHMMRREAKILQEIGSNSPNVVPLLRFIEMPFELIMIVPFASGGCLAHCSKICRMSGCCLEEAESRKLAQQMLSGLSYLHGQAIVHADVKPDNVLLHQCNGAMLAQLTDFGLSVKIPIGEEFVTLNHVQGTSGYIPAEVRDEKRIMYASDLFALGVVMFELLASYQPFFPVSQVLADLEFDDACWDCVSIQARFFVTSLLSPCPELRGSAQRHLLENPWTSASTCPLALPRSHMAPTLITGYIFHSLDNVCDVWNDFWSVNSIRDDADSARILEERRLKSTTNIFDADDADSTAASLTDF